MAVLTKWQQAVKRLVVVAAPRLRGKKKKKDLDQ
jgi:hypothetical protein